MTFGENILKLRRSHNLSQEELAERLLVSRQTISLWETDQTLPTIENLLLLKEIFDIQIDEMCGYDGFSDKYKKIIDKHLDKLISSL